ncbi:MAG TPA: hypothetical protein VD969_01745 [Symbiobacteriaceae bacterium]|nr:hypothetical protein [Symbiobacteriaceae bacterium]
MKESVHLAAGNAGHVTIAWSVSDALSGIATAPADSVITGEGDDLSANASVRDNAGNIATDDVTGIKIDRTAPKIKATRTPANDDG